MVDRLEGRVAVVTGAGSGIGRVLAQRFAGEGAAVVVVDIDGESALETASEVTAAGGRVRAYQTDVTRRDEVVATASGATAEFGKVDVLVNNAAVTSDTPFDQITDEQWHHQVGVTLFGSFLCAQALLPGMAAAGRGVVLNIGSVNAISYVGEDAYSAAKAGLFSLTRGIAVRYGPRGVRCNLIAPGTIRTPAWEERLARDPDVLDRLAAWYPLGRVGTPDDVASAALFLASEEASWITGACLTVDGGLLAGNTRFAADVLGPGGPSA